MKQSRTLLDRTLVITTLVCLLPLLFSALVYADLPDQVAIHFNAAGEPDNYAPKAFAAFGLPLLLTLLNVVMQIGLKADPKRDPKERIYHISRWLIAPLNLFLSPLTLLIAMGKPIEVERVVPMGFSILFLIIGNYLPKCKQNYRHQTSVDTGKPDQLEKNPSLCGVALDSDKHCLHHRPVSSALMPPSSLSAYPPGNSSDSILVPAIQERAA